ncbi:sensor histidine kinase [Pseudonocardia xinjiangensis]|uniref:sensor histidine kinase n=1 Tax=Pseudonocardia xinjiangensis TaxID=75289 RepID=UPI003D93018F
MPVEVVTRLSRGARVLLVVACVAAESPALLLDPVVGAPWWGRAAVVGLLAVQAGGMWFLARAPVRAAAVVITAGAGIQLLYPVVGPGITLVALCTVAWLRRPRWSLWVLAGTGMLAALVWLLGRSPTEALLWAAGALLAWSWGELGRTRSARRRAETRRAVLEERARIARELHDVLAHTVSVMVVQAGAAADVFDVSPERARAAVCAIESSGRNAQAELRRFLRTVRPDPGMDDEPQPGLADLTALAASVTRAGLPVALDVDVHTDVQAGVALSAYRIVQEALTNTLRHAHATRAQVAVRLLEGELLVDVHDDGRGMPGRSAAGQGLVGMRERAELLGGRLRTAPDPDGGFRVSARLPLQEPA